METLTVQRIADNVMAWVEALESGNKPQTKRYLHGPNGYCCLGVGCELLVDRGLDVFVRREAEGVVSYGGAKKVLPEQIQGALGLVSEIGDNLVADALTEMNDDGVPFPTIAKFIRSLPNRLFKSDVESELRSRGWGAAVPVEAK